ncbi:UDP-N-acetylmuramate dehydrogenase [Spartinivicinus poritis]|uniref:UDP-N-acetylenolpyruvoylglucosamine reductase n=1 Tax=Spartinivicinus poritis TaxID=2994640 RepID=A0ABT5U8I7_9GAMM|nr:UDP-N-acetylmuramate dehydrogenase [Spartinivicinus sp. A2-2]MDE1462617.1 UDP-N-acetylmuramate dehydrogenase [Spartinivicinus sp. A2-2]
MSLSVKRQVALQSHHTLGCPATTEYWVEVRSLSELTKAVRYAKSNQLMLLPLGGGSNVVFTQHFDGLIVKIAILGKQVGVQQNGQVIVEAGAGENWHQFVCWTLQQGLSGLENLSLIPGTVGAAPIQNIGAYGVELKEVMECLWAFNRETEEVKQFSVDECQFGYRESIFKQPDSPWIIAKVAFRLNTEFQPKLHYHPLSQLLADKPVTPELVSDTVCHVRASKLPDPLVLGNAGSFFKNPVISQTQLQAILQSYPEVPHYPAANDQVKLAAGWLIEQCNFKGQYRGDVGVHDKQALVIVNKGAATGNEVMALASQIVEKVSEQFGVELEVEPRVY